MSQNEFISIEDTKKYYLNNIARYGIEAPRTMGYHCGPIDDRLISNLLPESIPSSYTVLDVGCGLGQLIPILESRFQNSKIESLIGIDIVDEFIDHSKNQYPQHDFIAADFLEWPLPRQFDLVVAAGVLVSKISNFELYLEKFIEKMVLASKGWIAFNVVGSCGPTYTAKHLATVSKQKIEEILSKNSDADWQIQDKEVFPGAKDLFVCGKKRTD
jgi:trans-aconitate methyltransferase